MDFFGYDEGDFIPCEVCDSKAVDIHHLDPRGMGGKNPGADNIENLQALCRNCHKTYGDRSHLKAWLKSIHLKLMEPFRKVA